MARLLLSDDEWDLLSDIFLEPASTGRPPVDRRKVVDGIFWILRTGSPWRDLPEEFGKWKMVWRLFDQWNSDGSQRFLPGCKTHMLIPSSLRETCGVLTERSSAPLAVVRAVEKRGSRRTG
jgi:transposase